MQENGSDWQLPSAPAEGWTVTIPTDDESISRRRRALAPIQVLTDVERNKAQYDGDFWGSYDLFNIALAVIDQVALAMGISAGQTWDEAVDYAAGQAARQIPDASGDEWMAVAERVVVSLVTTDVHIVPYVVHAETGPRWVAQRFRLLYVHSGGDDGGEHLRASEQAINIFVEALDLDIEAAQIANEAQLSALIARGAVASAVQIARHARYRSIQYQERVRRIVADTLINPDAHDWLGDVPTLLESALAHVRARLEAEAALMDAVAERRSVVDDSAQLIAANQLIEILRECRHRHNELHRHLIGARSRLREALNDRFARPPQAAHRVNVGSDLLGPFLARPISDCLVASGRLLAAVGGVGMRWWPALSTLTDELCAPPRTPDAGEEISEPEFGDDDQPQWWEPYEDTTEALLTSLDTPIRLSQLLTRAREAEVADCDGQPLDSDLLAAAVLHAAHRAWATHLSGRAAGEQLVVAMATGDLIDADGIRSDDLLLVPAVVSADIDTAAETSDAGQLLVEDLEGASEELSA
ncbi:hypothetical protein CQY20_22025 [Mycolicibacterium agri]|uniref:Uncharacterized protein n=1 Tax=Mycolicibacterium agri TaxID=36811 RepID=A0A2A7MUK9_MYCAG|nr:hypothetical protein [Mycolicibacterium agri]PEG35354.1 hypothetical protein CQY20_22025 [Mycolicibacterium agri]GFG53485.1 hypothetical protein MAGR_49260 [Mycolicibacterium agri]